MLFLRVRVRWSESVCVRALLLFAILVMSMQVLPARVCGSSVVRMTSIEEAGSGNWEPVFGMGGPSSSNLTSLSASSWTVEAWFWFPT